ncbi:thermonuclease family protein [Rhizobium sp. SL42]|uniref:thermonuclease family protein n=1 Tax=Rhizobium sp. SL42 TaxID=2806346 RepID=UPI001F458133|nr:thermonuclease family protein [Rhizobium sp. SL42]UJW75452.1 thermonuclease family protein [Rhizobium sp. SL42]
MLRYHTPWLVLLTLTLSAGQCHAGQTLDGPVSAQVVRVIDGDTILVEAMPWPDHRISTYVRLRGIDAPELKSRCPAFREAAREAQDQLTEFMSGQEQVSLTDISGDKYFGRVVAKLILADGRSAADLLLEAGLVEPYAGRTKPRHHCPDT